VGGCSVDYIEQNSNSLLNNLDNSDRFKKLDNFREKRNLFSHFKPFTQQDAQEMFNILIESDDSFYKYFVGAFKSDDIIPK